jgi:hypothetical protein
MKKPSKQQTNQPADEIWEQIQRTTGSLDWDTHNMIPYEDESA